MDTLQKIKEEVEVFEIPHNEPLYMVIEHPIKGISYYVWDRLPEDSKSKIDILSHTLEEAIIWELRTYPEMTFNEKEGLFKFDDKIVFDTKKIPFSGFRFRNLSIYLAFRKHT